MNVQFGLRWGMCVYILALMLFGGMAQPAHAQGKATGQFLDAAVVRVTDIAAKAKFAQYGYADGLSILGGWVDEKASLSFSMELQKGVDYLLLAGGDNDALDVDLELQDATGIALAADAGFDPEAIVQFTPRQTARFTLKLTLFKSRQKVPCVCVATILKKNGWNVPVKNLDDATGRVAKALADGDAIAKKTGHRLDLRRAPNQWAIFGGVLRQGDNFALHNISSGFGDLLFVGAGDNFAQSLRVDVESNDNKLILKEGRNNQLAAIDYRGTGKMHGLRLTNVKARSPAVVLLSSMDIYTPD